MFAVCFGEEDSRPIKPVPSNPEKLKDGGEVGLEHVKAGLARLKRAEDERMLQSRLADLERERYSLSNLWLSKKLDVKYALEAQEKDMRRLKELEQQIDSMKREIEKLQAEIPRRQEQAAEVYKRIEARKEAIQKLEREEHELAKKYQDLEHEILNIQSRLKEVQQG
ncbi:MAG: hypothetical protein QXK89_06165 [Candidatus Bathyarchaeia archaeon]